MTDLPIRLYRKVALVPYELYPVVSINKNSICIQIIYQIIVSIHFEEYIAGVKQ